MCEIDHPFFFFFFFFFTRLTLGEHLKHKQKSRGKRDSNQGSSALEADALTTRPTRNQPTHATNHHTKPLSPGHKPPHQATLTWPQTTTPSHFHLATNSCHKPPHQATLTWPTTTPSHSHLATNHHTKPLSPGHQLMPLTTTQSHSYLANNHHTKPLLPGH